MADLKSDEYLEQLGRKLVKILVLTLIIESIGALILFIFIHGFTLIFECVIFLIIGVGYFLFLRKPRNEYMTSSLATSIVFVISLTILGIILIILPPATSLDDIGSIISNRYLTLYIFSIDIIFIIWTIILNLHKKKEVP